MFSVSYPRTIHEHVTTLCRRIHPTNEPQFVPLRPEGDCIMQECFNNVRTKVDAQGGRIVYGWAIWQHKLMIEAEHHAVYEEPSTGLWVDITPQDIPIDRILFLPDETAAYDFDRKLRTTNIRLPMVSDPRARRMCDLLNQADDIFNQYPAIDHRTTIPSSVALEITKLRMAATQLAQELDFGECRTVGRNDPCPCGSGKKFKKCHGGPNYG